MKQCPQCGKEIPTSNHFCSRKCHNQFKGRGEDAAIWDGETHYDWHTGKPAIKETTIETQETIKETQQRARSRPNERIIKETKITIEGIKPGTRSHLFLYATEGDYPCPALEAKGESHPYADQEYCDSFGMGAGCAEIEKGCPAYCKNAKR